MSLEQITSNLTSLRSRIHGINAWIQANPTITDPNAYEIMDCNVQFAEIIAELKAYYVKTGEIPADLDNQELMATVNFLAAAHPEIEGCYHELGTMDILRNIADHPFFTLPEVNEMYCSVKACQDFATYDLPSDEGLRRIKRELLCKSMSVPFYIWQVHRTEPDYQYDNILEFEGMKQMHALYQSSEEPCQFGPQVDALLSKINTDYKYSTQEKTTEAKK